MTRKSPSRFRFALMGVLAALVGVAVFDAGPVQAQVPAKVEAQTRPDFGLLLDPPTRTRPRASSRRWSYGDHRRGHGHGYPYPGPAYPPPYADEQVVMVDCGGNPGSGGDEDAVRRLAPGGTLIVRGRAGACVGWLNIDKPMTIIGDNMGFDRRDWAANPTASLQSPDGSRTRCRAPRPARRGPRSCRAGRRAIAGWPSDWPPSRAGQSPCCRR